MIASTQTNSPLFGHGQTESPVAIATARLRTAGLRITQPRLKILATLVKFGRPTSIEVIHDDLGRRGCDLVTVYRCLAAFEDIGIVRRSYFHNGTTLFSLSVDDRPRYHVVSKSNQIVEALDSETAQELQAALLAVETKLRERGYTEVGHVAQFFGIAPSLARSQPAAAPAVEVRETQAPVGSSRAAETNPRVEPE